MGKFSIMVVDDSKTVRAEIRSILSKVQFEGEKLEIHEAEGFEDFKTRYEPDKYALVLTDLVMEEEQSGIRVVNYIRHELGDAKTRIVLMTANPEKVPLELLENDCDVNYFLEKKTLSELSLKICVIAMLKAYKNVIAFEKALGALENIVESSKARPLEETLIQTFFQIRSFLILKNPTLEVGGVIYLDGVKIFPPEFVSRQKSGNSYNHIFETDIAGKRIRMEITSSKRLSDVDVDYINSLLSSLKRAYFYSEMSDIESDLVLRLANLIEVRSEETGNHVKRVAEISHVLAIESGFDPTQANLLRQASALHDIGKVGIPDHILNKPGKLDEREFAIIKEHTLIGFEILRNSRLKTFELGALVALQHHERWDGTGYPYGLSGSEIALEARIVEIADVFEALTHNRCYRPAWPVEKAVEYIVEMSGKQFDPALVEIFRKKLKDIVDILETFKD
ncbi:HD domain-containing phosphohydrolase [Fervidobacterium thailandense]|uniref:Phosphohydrolase n=1 Tax=Fervidobacterium thailandense TaxID=1008305 RepID=A0A1E3G2E0_9BACT|nr:HD domain-containing phosphohydrolase [Fervidobacterium thailandense]ODN30332.1 phosphohydrolase [Fervidobacterium thailandense]